MAVRLTDKILPLNDAFTGMVDASQVIAGSMGAGTFIFDIVSTTANIAGTPKHLRFNVFNPSAVYADDTQVCIWPETDAAITITKITVTLDASGNDVAGDLKYADTFIGLANPVVINDFDTTSGVREDSSITSGSVAASKAIYIQFDSSPNAAITQICIDIQYDYD